MSPQPAETAAPSETEAPPFYSHTREHSYKSTLKAEDLFREHDNRLAVVVGSGPSLADFDFEQLNRDWIFSFAINDEAFRNRDRYRPDSWIFFDSNVLNRYRDRDPETDLIFTREALFQEAFTHAIWPKRPVPEWVHRVHTFESRSPYRPDQGGIYMHRTTATAALTLAVQMGFKHVALLGVDLYTTGDAYYYTGTKPEERRKRAATMLDANRYAEDRHLRMMADFTMVKSKLDAWGWDGTVYQCSTFSPLSCFKKMRFDKAVKEYGR